MVYPSIGRVPLYPYELLFPPPISLYMNPKNLALPCFLVYFQPSSHFRNVNIRERDIFAVVAVVKIKTYRPLPVDPILPPIPSPTPILKSGAYLNLCLGCGDRVLN